MVNTPLIPQTEDQDKNLVAKKAAFLIALSLSGVIRKGCDAAQTSRPTVARWRREDKDFEAAFSDSMEDFRDSLVEEATVRGRDGWNEPVIHQGRQCYQLNIDGSMKLDDNFEPIPLVVNRRSDKLLETQLKAHDPRYRDKASLEVSGPNGGPIMEHRAIEFILPNGKTMKDYDDEGDSSLESRVYERPAIAGPGPGSAVDDGDIDTTGIPDAAEQQ